MQEYIDKNQANFGYILQVIFMKIINKSFVGKPIDCLHYEHAQQLAVQPVHLGNFVQPSIFEAY